MAGEKILLADDDHSLRETLQEFLTEQGYAVTAAADGHEAMAAMKDQEFALAILDLRLPGYSGLDLLFLFKAHTPDTEVILFTGHAGLESAVQALRLGAYDYLLKADLRLADLKTLVARALERRHLALENRELVVNISKAQEELVSRRARELTQVRQIAETLAGPLTWDQLVRGLVNLIWESLPLELLGLQLHGPEEALPLSAFRRRPDVPEATDQTFQELLQGQLAPDPAAPPAGTPLPAMLWERLQVGNVTLVAGAGRHEPLTPEETELFRIFILQGEAGIKNLVLFDQVKSMAIRDALTGLYNYGYFKVALHYEVEKSRRYKLPLSLLFLDVDDFKLVNDTLGHLKGDKTMRQVAAILKQGIRQADLLCRYGGDEFVMLLSQTPPDQAIVLAERLRQRIAKSSMNRLEQRCKVTVSIGVAGLGPEMSTDDLIKAADEAHYRAKQAGKNRVVGPEPLPQAEKTSKPARKLQPRPR
ncbi:MAG: diguanylate cyclase [Deltaproteobacteria bacterium]|nr:diguanylate cyclase [Deltaproteobacteria bacterium]